MDLRMCAVLQRDHGYLVSRAKRQGVFETTLHCVRQLVGAMRSHDEEVCEGRLKCGLFRNFIKLEHVKIPQVRLDGQLTFEVAAHAIDEINRTAGGGDIVVKNRNDERGLSVGAHLGDGASPEV